MVECELYPLIYSLFKIKVLIDTWWNVNDIIKAIIEGLISF